MLWPWSTSLSGVQIEAPSSQVLPTVVLNIPTIVSSCSESFSLDYSGPYGSGGRSWKSIIINVTNSDQNLENLNVLLNQLVLSQGQTLNIPLEYFIPSESPYNFSVTLCNFLGFCSSSTQSMQIVSNDSLSLLILGGTQYRTISPGESLSIQTKVIFTKCSQTSNSNNFEYSWKLIKNNNIEIDFVNLSHDPSQLLLKSGVLSYGSDYKVEVSVKAVNNDIIYNSSNHILISVKSGEIIANIDGGVTERVIRGNSEVVINASDSYDENILGTNLESNLKFLWSCKQLFPVTSLNCDTMFTSQSLQNLSIDSNKSLQLAALSQASGTAEITLTLTSYIEFDLRLTKKSIHIKIIPLTSSQINLAIKSNTLSDSKQALGYYSDSILGMIPISAVINADHKFKLEASVNVPNNLIVTSTWSLNSNQVNLETASLTPISKTMDGSISTSNYIFSLKLDSNTLIKDNSYLFTLTSNPIDSTLGLSSSSNIAIRVNDAPTGGFFTISPELGYEMLDKFNFIASQWNDNDLPLTYKFQYKSISDSLILLGKFESISYGSFQLPAGSSKSDNENKVVCIFYCK